MATTQGTVRTTGGGAGGFLEGVAFLPRGIRMFAGMRDSWVLGMLPGLIAAVLAGTVLVLLLIWVEELAAFLTPFAGGWSEAARRLLRVLLAVALVLGYLAVVVRLFATIANIIGQPFFEAISDRVEYRLGAAPAGVDEPWWRSLPGATADSVKLLALTAAFALPLFALGFVPVLGQTVVPVLGLLVNGFFLAGELLGIPLERRGLRLRARLRLLWRHRALTAGFGVTAFAVFLVPVMNVLAMPGAIVGGTLLARRMLPEERAPAGPSEPPGSGR